MQELHGVTKDIADIGREAGYTIVGLGVLALQRAQVERVELQRRLAQDLQLDERLSDVRAGLVRQTEVVDGLVEEAFQFVETTFEPLEEQLPAPAREFTERAKVQAREVRTQLRDLLIGDRPGETK